MLPAQTLLPQINQVKTIGHAPWPSAIIASIKLQALTGQVVSQQQDPEVISTAYEHLGAISVTEQCTTGHGQLLSELPGHLHHSTSRNTHPS